MDRAVLFRAASADGGLQPIGQRVELAREFAGQVQPELRVAFANQPGLVQSGPGVDRQQLVDVLLGDSQP